MPYDYARALQLLRIGSGLDNATFRDGQEEAIRHIVDGRGRLLVVQRTGWGKSFVYFIATKLLREQGHGSALLISPLLALMRNQLLAAQRMGMPQMNAKIRVHLRPCSTMNKRSKQILLDHGLRHADLSDSFLFFQRDN